jgi:hypothetical protein
MKIHFEVTHTSTHLGTYSYGVCGARSWDSSKLHEDPEKTTCGSCKRSPKWRAAMVEKTGEEPDMARTWRKIIRRDTTWEEKASLTTRTFSWSATYRHKLTLECGHTQIRRGYSDPPKTQVICKSWIPSEAARTLPLEGENDE